MKSLTGWLAAAFVVAAGALTPATAATIPINDVFNPDPDVFFGSSSNATCQGDTTTSVVTGFDQGSNGPDAGTDQCYSLAFTFDLTPEGYTNPPDSLNPTDLTLYFYDNSDPGTGNKESVAVKIDLNSQQFDITNFALGSSLPPFDVTGTLADGILNVLLTRGTIQGEGQVDFMFDKATLVGSFEDSDIQFIPEPASLVLFGGGLAAAVARLRRRGQRRA